MATALSPEEKEAKAAYNKAYREANKEVIAARHKDWYEANKEKKSASKKAWYGVNKEKVLAGKKVYHEANKERISASKKAHHEANPHIAIVKSRIRKSRIAQQCPIWADQPKIAEIYRDAAEFRVAGLNVHVDHIVPLKARLASGLHVHQNLTIKLAGWNDSKSNKYDPMGAAP